MSDGERSRFDYESLVARERDDEGERLNYESLVARERDQERRGKVAGWVVILVTVGSVVFVVVKGILGLKLPSPD